MLRKIKTTEKYLKNTTVITFTQQWNSIQSSKFTVHKLLSVLTDQIVKILLNKYSNEDENDKFSENLLIIKS